MPSSAAVIRKPKKQVQHPWGDYSIKFKHLTPIKFTPVDKKKNTQNELVHETDDRFMCPVTFKTFGRATKAAVLKTTGDVVHMEAIEVRPRRRPAPPSACPCRR